jgi:hypothetical protein
MPLPHCIARQTPGQEISTDSLGKADHRSYIQGPSPGNASRPGAQMRGVIPF